MELRDAPSEHGVRSVWAGRFWRPALLVLAVAFVLVAIGLPRDELSWLRHNLHWFNVMVGFVERPFLGVNLIHFLLFFGLAFAASIAMGRARIRSLLIGLAAFAAATEVVQFVIAGRHPRWSDFAVDLAASVLGVACARGGRRLLSRVLGMSGNKVVLFANTDWYLWNFRRSLALALREAGHDVLLVSPDGPHGEKLRALGLRWQPVPMNRRSLNPLREAALLLHLWRLLRRERPALVHGFTIKCAVYGSLAARLAGVQARVNAVAGMGYVFTSDDAKARMLRPVVRMLMRLALGGRDARLILQNPDDVALFERAGLVDAASIRLIPGSGVDCTRFAPDASRVPGERIRVLLPARLLWDKGLAEYADAARLLRQRGVAVDLLLAGEPDPGNPAAVPEARVRGWVDEGLLQWLGHVDDMPALFRSAEVVALPSYREGLPKGLIEAAASGCALVATDVPGCREVVEHDVDGLRVPVRDAVALADAIERLVRDGTLRARLAAAARRKALALFDERIVIEGTLGVYRELGVC